ncbi:hypothetical protein KM043_005726 [Ampulex compressa]|nr:hypothetical protein KM043_005726 [Ampulex compressa]
MRIAATCQSQDQGSKRLSHGWRSDETQLDIGSSSHQNFGNLSNDTTGIGIIEDLQGMPERNEGESSPNFWTIESYQKYFNVNTKDVVERIKRSMVPHSTENYLISHIRPNPDLTSKYHWRYNFHVVSYAATCIFLYAWLLPLALWAALRWTSSSRNTDEELIESNVSPGLLELTCLYGYSLSIYVPVAFLWTIQIGWLQWTLAIVTIFLSGGVLLRSLLPVVTGRHKIIYVAVILGMHLLLAAGFMLYFFHASSTGAVIPDMDHSTSSAHPSTAAKLLDQKLVDQKLEVNKQH